MPLSATDMAPPAPSGRQFEIANGHQRAVITEVGATLRSYTVRDVAVLDGFGVDEMASGGRGQVLAPWPNRLGDGKYSFEGREGRAPLNEPQRRNAIHGLVRWMPWALYSSMQNVVVLRCLVHPQPAYPWTLELSVEYRLGRDGLTVESAATNLSDVAAPFGIGFHPYLTVGGVIDVARLSVPARARLVADERGLPTGQASASPNEFDFSAPRSIGSTKLDTAFTDLIRGDNGRAVVTLSNLSDSDRVSLWMDRSFGYVMVFTGDTLEPARRRRAVAIEPMTCPPDAFRSGNDVVRLDPGETWKGSWGITPKLAVGA